VSEPSVTLRFRVLGSGSGGNATLVEGGGARVLLDAGLGPRQLAERLWSAGVDPASLDVVFVSHEHGDHARGAAAFSARWGVPLAGTRGTFRAARLAAGKLPAYEPLEPGEVRTVRRLCVRAVAVPHDAARPVAFVVKVGDASLGHAVDLGHLNRGIVDALRTCDAVLIESNYDPAMLRDGPYPWSLKERILGPLGHLSNGDVARLIERGLGEACRRVVLAHLSEKNNHPDLARTAAEEALERAGRPHVRVELAAPDGTGWIPVRPHGPAGPPSGQMRLF
jgi:phosphoribosyl 1,2-cyclic phosphodiesterase